MLKTWQALSKEDVNDVSAPVGRGKSKDNVNLASIGFDIETTNVKKSQTAYMYIWQCAVNDVAYYGRTWDEFFCFLATLREKLHDTIYIFIHNMSFEMSFLLPRLHEAAAIERIFARDVRDPLEVKTKNGIVFRDTLA